MLNIIWALNRPYKTGETKGEKAKQEEREKRDLIWRCVAPLPRRENPALSPSLGVMGQQQRGKNT